MQEMISMMNNVKKEVSSFLHFPFVPLNFLDIVSIFRHVARVGW